MKSVLTYLLLAYKRNIDSENVDTFKKDLDSFLSQVSDRPTDAGYGWAAETNILLHQLSLFLNIN
jgi:hypothetical protein